MCYLVPFKVRLPPSHRHMWYTCPSCLPATSAALPTGSILVVGTKERAEDTRLVIPKLLLRFRGAEPGNLFSEFPLCWVGTEDSSVQLVPPQLGGLAWGEGPLLLPISFITLKATICSPRDPRTLGSARESEVNCDRAASSPRVPSAHMPPLQDLCSGSPMHLHHSWRLCSRGASRKQAKQGLCHP